MHYFSPVRHMSLMTYLPEAGHKSDRSMWKYAVFTRFMYVCWLHLTYQISSMHNHGLI